MPEWIAAAGPEVLLAIGVGALGFLVTIFLRRRPVPYGRQLVQISQEGRKLEQLFVDGGQDNFDELVNSYFRDENVVREELIRLGGTIRNDEERFQRHFDFMVDYNGEVFGVEVKSNFSKSRLKARDFRNWIDSLPLDEGQSARILLVFDHSRDDFSGKTFDAFRDEKTRLIYCSRGDDQEGNWRETLREQLKLAVEQISM